ncbi:MAG: DUF4129 domain-containing protein [Anaerolineae bacterium]|nr:DUF4129 domain-containing protein [Anaerolineae bacterium]
MTGRGVPWRRELLLLTILAMDATWLAPWAALLTGTTREWSRAAPPGAVYALLVAALVTTKALWASRLALGLQQALAGALAVLGGLLLIGTSLYGDYPLLSLAWAPAWLSDLATLRGHGLGGLVLAGVALYAWGRAISLVQRPPAAEAVGFYFRVGIVAWFWFHLLGLLSGNDAPLAWLFLFFALGLLAIGLARVEEVERGRGAVRSPFTLSWALLLAAAALGAVGVGLLATLAFSRTLVAAVWRALRPVGAVLRWVLYQVAALTFLLLEPLIDALYHVLAPAGDRLGAIPTPPAQPVQPTPQQTGVPVAIQAVLWTIATLVALAIVVLVVTGLQQRESEGETEEGRPLAWEEAGGEEGDLGARLRRLQGRLAARLRGVGPAPYALATVREIYASLLRLASGEGVVRDDAETPYEFERRLDGAWPEAQAQVEALTDAYVRVRYGERRVGLDELEGLRAAWQRLREKVEERSTGR